MAKFVSEKSEQRWNRTADTVDGNGAGNRFVRGPYRPPQGGGGAACAELNLSPGSYPAVAGETIAAGTSGGVLYDGKVYTSTNQSLCNVAIGNRIGLHVSPNCEAFFVPCTCDCGEPPTPEFCDALYAVCINGEIRLMAATEAGNTQTWDLTGCCEPHPCPVTTVDVTLTCVPETEIVSYLVEWGPRTATGTFGLLPIFRVLGNQCDDPPGVAICAFTFVIASTAASAAAFCGSPCGDPPDPAPSDCCDQSLYFCLNGVSELLDVDGGNFTWDVSECCDTEASLEITLSCNSATDTISLFYQYTAGMIYDSGTENVIMSEFCDDDAPRFITFTNATCFLQMLVSGVQFECLGCTGEPTTTAPPPP